MNWLVVTLIASLIAGLVAVYDKSLLQKRGFSDPWTYTFWLNVLGGGIALAAIPFGVALLSLSMMLLAFFAGAVFLLATFFFFLALQKGEASGALPIIGGVAPIATYVFSLLLLGQKLSGGDLFGFLLLVVSGMVFLSLEQKECRALIAFLGVGSGALFGLANVLKKIVFDAGPFLSGFVWISIGSAVAACCSLLVPHVRRRVFAVVSQTKISHKALYGINRTGALVSAILINIAIAQGHPALVDAAQGFKYVVIFFAAWFILKERFSGKVLFGKIFATLAIIFGLVWLGLVAYARSIPVDAKRYITWGITFSDAYSRDKLGLDWHANFNAIVDELRPKKMRLIAYWDEIEKSPGVFDFSDLDWQMNRAMEQGIRVVVVVGMREPRWPECHIPAWASLMNMVAREDALHAYIRATVERYRANPALAAWQVENEPFLRFGLCATRPPHALDEEIALVKSLDPGKPILTTDGGEFGLWNQAIRAGDIFGTTMYRRTYPPSIGRYVGVIDYPLSPAFFRFRQKLARLLTSEYTKPFIVIELQAEPWGRLEVPLISYEEQKTIFSPDYFHETIQYAKETGFDEYYLWGAEWWYWVREKHGDARYWDEAKKLFLK